MSHTTPLGDPIGAPVENWTPPPRPPRTVIEGRHVRLEPISAVRHTDDLFGAFSADPDGANWTHRMNGPYPTREALYAWLAEIEAKDDMVYFAYVDKASGKALGNGAFMAIAPAAGSIEVGSIMFSPAMQRTALATEAMYLKMKWAFEAGYRRYEWTCDPLNAASMGAAERSGFTYEALFRQAYVTKGRNRDKAIFAIIDRDWPGVSAAFEAWLDPANFDADGQQKQSLRDLTAPHVHARTAPSDRGMTNALGQPGDVEVPDWSPRPVPGDMVLEGRYCRLERLSMAHAPALHAAHLRDAEGRNWTYLPDGPFEDLESYTAWVETAAKSPDPLQFTIIIEDGPVGTASLMRIAPEAGSIEVGYITFSPLLQRTVASTEAMFLMMKWSFEAGYRRYEWKCNDLNAPSRRAAQRLGFSYEGVFRQAQITKAANRDTAWYGCIDSEWPALKAAFETWLDPENFDADGQQRQSLSDLTQPILVAKG
ncbi:MAG: GNAT family N-acetyltransferase [Paracoccaceae bacterium]